MAKGERLQYQIAFYVNRRLFPSDSDVERAKVRAAKKFLRTGESIKGVKIVARWRNPDNRWARHANWKTSEESGQSLFDFWQTLHGARGALRGFAARYGG